MKRCISVLLALMLLALCACAPAETGPHAESDYPAPTESAAQAESPKEAVTAMNAVAYPAAQSYDDYEAQQQNREDNAVTDEFRAALDAFAYAAGAALLPGAKENANVSPLSLYLALALAAGGAVGDTQAELLTLLGMLDAQALADQCARLYRLLYADNGVGKLLIGNSLWLGVADQGGTVPFHQAYLDAAARDFYAELYRVNFADEKTGQAMGKWVSDHTGGVLSPAFPADPQQVMAILNTVYFYDEWISAFSADRTEKGTFHGINGDVTADFMNRTAMSGFARGEGFTRASLGLKTQGDMVFVLPDEGVALSDLLSSADSLKALFTGGEDSYGDVTWRAPKFRYGCRYDLADTLKALGVKAAFDPAVADFSAMADGPVWLSKVNQQTHIAVDEKGVEAAAYTEMGFAGAAMPSDHADMILDRPFLYGIVSTEGTLLFMGVVNDPTLVS